MFCLTCTPNFSPYGENMIQYKIDVLKCLSDKGYSSYKLKNQKIFGNATIQNFRDNKVCYGDALNKLCKLLNCQPGDILEYVTDTPGTSNSD